MAADGGGRPAHDLLGLWGTRVDWQYDALRRPTAVPVTGAPTAQRQAEKTTYGEQVTNAQALNLRGSVYQRFDGAGVATVDQKDFDGDVTSVSRQLLDLASTDVDWARALRFRAKSSPP